MSAWQPLDEHPGRRASGRLGPEIAPGPSTEASRRKYRRRRRLVVPAGLLRVFWRRKTGNSLPDSSTLSDDGLEVHRLGVARLSSSTFQVRPRIAPGRHHVGQDAVLDGQLLLRLRTSRKRSSWRSASRRSRSTRLDAAAAFSAAAGCGPCRARRGCPTATTASGRRPDALRDEVAPAAAGPLGSTSRSKAEGIESHWARPTATANSCGAPSTSSRSSSGKPERSRDGERVQALDRARPSPASGRGPGP